MAWVEVGDLALGERVRLHGGETATLTRKVPRPGWHKVYNLEIWRDHNFHVGEEGVWVHNSCNYRKTFFDANPDLKGKVVVHHGVEQQVLDRYPGLFSEAEIHMLDNLRGIPKDINGPVHLSAIRKRWNQFYNDNPNPTKQGVLDFADQIDSEFGHLFTPPH